MVLDKMKQQHKLLFKQTKIQPIKQNIQFTEMINIFLTSGNFVAIDCVSLYLQKKISFRNKKQNQTYSLRTPEN